MSDVGQRASFRDTERNGKLQDKYYNYNVRTSTEKAKRHIASVICTQVWFPTSKFRNQESVFKPIPSRHNCNMKKKVNSFQSGPGAAK